jgi:hypothetical protein
VCGDTTFADLHAIVQIGFDWGDIDPSPCVNWEEPAHTYEVERRERNGEEDTDVSHPAIFGLTDSTYRLPSEDLRERGREFVKSAMDHDSYGSQRVTERNQFFRQDRRPRRRALHIFDRIGRNLNKESRRLAF